MTDNRNPLANVLSEMIAAEAKHGANYMGNLTKDAPDLREILEDAVALGREAKFQIEEMGDTSRFLVFLEEIGELAEDILAERDYTGELTQCAAMPLAWLGVDASAVQATDGLLEVCDEHGYHIQRYPTSELKRRGNDALRRWYVVPPDYSDEYCGQTLQEAVAAAEADRAGGTS